MRKFYVLLALVMVWASIPITNTVWGWAGQASSQSKGKSSQKWSPVKKPAGGSQSQASQQQSQSQQKAAGTPSAQQASSFVTFGKSDSDAGQNLLSVLKGDSGDPQDSWAALAAAVQKKCQMAERSCILRLGRVTEINNSFSCYKAEAPKSGTSCEVTYALIPFDFLKGQLASGKGIEDVLKKWDVDLEPWSSNTGKQLPASLIADCVQQVEMGGAATCNGLSSCDTKQPLYYSYADVKLDAGQTIHTYYDKAYPARQYVAGCAQESYVFQCMHPTYPFQATIVLDFAAIVAHNGTTLNATGGQVWPDSDLLSTDLPLEVSYCKTDGTFAQAKFAGLWVAKVARPVAFGGATHRVLCGIGNTPSKNVNEVLQDTGKYPLEQTLDKNWCSPVPDLPGMEICLLAVHSQPMESFQEECSFDYVIRPLQ